MAMAETMTDIRLFLILITTIVLTGTLYSVANQTYLDTSDPLLANLPHPLHASHYFANKLNPLNVYFIKNAWGWTSVAFLVLWGTSPPSTRIPRRIGNWLLATTAWAMFTLWFFGPSILDRVVVASGGECVLRIPPDHLVSVPTEFCFGKSTLSAQTHPSLFTTVINAASLPNDFRAVPRLRRGHDVSGHIFLPTLSILFLVDQLRYSSRSRHVWSVAHKVAVAANWSLIAIWMLACLTTSVYFHSPWEKLSGYLLGVASYMFTQLLVSESAPVKRHLTNPGRE